MLKPEFVAIGMDAMDKWDLIARMAHLIGKSDKITDEDDLLEKLIEREKNMTTGLGHRMAIPHAMSEGVKEIVVGAATLKEPIDFESFDFEDIDVIFIIASPIDRDKKYMTILSQIAKLFSNPDFGKVLIAAKTPQEFIEIIADAGV